MPEFIYLDHNSTSPIAPEVADRMAAAYAQGYANPASQHRPGQIARAKLEFYRQEMASMLGARSTGMNADSLIFTSGGTESDNLAIFGLAALGRKRLVEQGSLDSDQLPRVLISSIEHPAVFSAAEQLVQKGFDVHRLPVDQQGVCRLDLLSGLLEPPTALVSVMLANNETGVIQPVSEIGQICHQQDVLLHTDAVQAVGKIPVSFSQLNVDAMTVTAHKLSGPRGVGGLLLRSGVVPEPCLFGGFQQMAIRPGTEDVALAAGFWQAIKLYNDAPDRIHEHLASLRNRLQQAIVDQFPEVIINGVEVERTPQTLNLAFPGINRQSFLMSADIEGLAISTGSACASGSSEPSPVLMAMGLDKTTVDGSIRFSVGMCNSLAEIDLAIERITKIVNRLR